MKEFILNEVMVNETTLCQFTTRQSSPVILQEKNSFLIVLMDIFSF